MLFWCAIAGLWGVAIAWRYRNFMNPDGISYLDIADNVLRSGPSALVNAHWSPFYPALIALWLLLFRPSPFHEFASIHALNALLYFVTAVSFGYFLRQLRAASQPVVSSNLIEESIFFAFGYALFFHFMNTDNTAIVVSPDLLLACGAFLSGGLFFQIMRGTDSRRPYIALGIVIAIGYLAKSLMLPAGIILLAVLAVPATPAVRHRRRLALAGLVMLVLSAPQIALVSLHVGHVSISETGRLNYLWWVNGIRQFEGWTGTPGGDVPVHGPRTILAKPKVLEFAQPIPGTYPLWYDPAYWYAGAKPRTSLREQIHVIRSNLRFYHLIWPDLRYPLEGLVVLAVLAYAGRNRLRHPELIFLIWPCAVLGMYALLFTEYRYAAPFLVLIWVAGYSAVLNRIDQAQRILLVILVCVVLVPVFREFFAQERRISKPGSKESPFTYAYLAPSQDPSEDAVVAQALQRSGTKAGDHIATVGPAFLDYFARISRVRVIAEIEEPDEFWNAPLPAVQTAERVLAQAGAKILVAKDRPPGFQAGLWRKIEGTQYSVLRLNG
jgi:hypothetical protein